jgi:CheY-like chemotaxis protein
MLTIRMALRFILEVLELTVMGKPEAVRPWRSAGSRPDIVTMDINMPGMVAAKPSVDHARGTLPNGITGIKSISMEVSTRLWNWVH